METRHSTDMDKLPTEQEPDAPPKRLSAEERAKRALEKRQMQVQQRQRALDESRKRSLLNHPAAASSADSWKQKSDNPTANASANPDLGRGVAGVNQQQLQAIRDRYMPGAKREQRKIRKMTGLLCFLVHSFFSLFL